MPRRIAQAIKKDKVGGFLGVGTNERGEVVIVHSDICIDERGVGHIVFSPSQARNLARILKAKAKEADLEVEQEPDK